jgi:hypothetical protein
MVPVAALFKRDAAGRNHADYHCKYFFGTSLYSGGPIRRATMTELKIVKSAAEIQPLVRYTPEETARNKKARDERRKAIRHQNARSKSLK